MKKGILCTALFVLNFIICYAIPWRNVLQEQDVKIEQKVPEKKARVKNVVLMIGDGMGLSHMYSTWVANKGKLKIETCDFVGLAKTYCYDRLITDSGAAGTALATGCKVRYHSVGVDTLGMPLISLVDVAQMEGKSAGIVVTCRLNDATPAAFCAHNANRDEVEAIISDYVDCGVDFIFGGGRKYFTERSDGRNILLEMQRLGYQIPNDMNALKAIQEGKILAVFSDYDLPKSSIREGMLSDAALKALDLLSQNEEGFFLMVEGSQIDDYGHFNQSAQLVEEILDFDETVGAVCKWAARDGETLVIVTSDHETGGLTLLGGDLSTGEIETHFSTGDHSGVMVPVYAWGPMSFLFSGIYENTDIYVKLKYLLENEK